MIRKLAVAHLGDFSIPAKALSTFWTVLPSAVQSMLAGQWNDVVEGCELSVGQGTPRSTVAPSPNQTTAWSQLITSLHAETSRAIEQAEKAKKKAMAVPSSCLRRVSQLVPRGGRGSLFASSAASPTPQYLTAGLLTGKLSPNFGYRSRRRVMMYVPPPHLPSHHHHHHHHHWCSFAHLSSLHMNSSNLVEILLPLIVVSGRTKPPPRSSDTIVVALPVA